MNHLSNDDTHKTIYALAKAQLELWLTQNLEEVQVLKECNWLLDSTVVLNTAKNRAILKLAIQDKQPDAELDYVYLMYAAKESSMWQVYYSGLPNLVFERKTHNAGKPITLSKLLDLSRAHINSIYYSNGLVIDQRINNALYA